MAKRKVGKQKKTTTAKGKARAKRRVKMDRAMAKLGSAKARMDSVMKAWDAEDLNSSRARDKAHRAKVDSSIKAEKSKAPSASRKEQLIRRIKMLEKEYGVDTSSLSPRAMEALSKKEAPAKKVPTEKKAAPKKKAATKKAVPKKTAPKKKAKTPTSKAGKKTGKSTIESGRALRERGTKAMRDANALIDSMAKSSGKSREPFEYYSGGKRVFGKEAEGVRERSNALRELRREQTLFKHRVKGRHKGETKALAYYKKQREKGKLKETDPAFINLAKIDSLQNRFSELGDSSFKEVQQGPGSRSVFSWGGNRKKNNGKK